MNIYSVSVIIVFLTANDLTEGFCVRVKRTRARCHREARCMPGLLVQ